MIKVGIIEDDPGYQIGLRAIIETQSDLQLMVAARSVEEFEARHIPVRWQTLTGHTCPTSHDQRTRRARADTTHAITHAELKPPPVRAATPSIRSHHNKTP